MALSKDDILNAIAAMSVMEVVDLVKGMEDKFGVSAAAAVAVAPAAGGGAAAAPVAEKTEFHVVLASSGEKKVNVIKVVRAIIGLGLKEAKDLVEGVPSTVKEGVSKDDARAVESGQVETCVEWSNGAISWRMKAAAMGVPFLPTRSMLGTDTLAYSSAVVVEDPFTGMKVCLLPALILDVGLIHVHRADIYGNAQIEGISGFAFEMSRACKRLIISAEEIIPTDEIRRYPDRTIIPYYLVDAVEHAPFGSHPDEMAYGYGRDEPGIREWIEMSKTPEGSQAYLNKYVYSLKDHSAYLELIGQARLAQLVEAEIATTVATATIVAIAVSVGRGRRRFSRADRTTGTAAISVIASSPANGWMHASVRRAPPPMSSASPLSTTLRRFPRLKMARVARKKAEPRKELDTRPRFRRPTTQSSSGSSTLAPAVLWLSAIYVVLHILRNTVNRARRSL